MSEVFYRLGLLQLRRGVHGKGLKNLRNALRLAELDDPQRQIHNAPGMNYGRFAEVLRHEISIYDSREH